MSTQMVITIHFSYKCSVEYSWNDAGSISALIPFNGQRRVSAWNYRISAPFIQLVAIVNWAKLHLYAKGTQEDRVFKIQFSYSVFV